MKKHISSIIAALLLLAILAGCAGGAGSSSAPNDDDDWGSSRSSSQGGVKDGEHALAICIGAVNHPVHRIAQMGFLTKAEELGYKAEVSGLDEGSAQELISKFESTITNGVDGVMLWTGDDTYYSMMRDFCGQCTFVVPHFAHDYLDTKDFIARNIASLAREYGSDAADYIVEQLAANGVTSGSIALTQSSANVTENAASDAFRRRIEEQGLGFNVIDVIFEGGEVAEAATKVTGIIQSHPDIVAGFGTTGGSCQSWSLAMQNTGKTGLVVVGTDYTEINLDLVDSGVISAIICQPLYDEAQKSAETLDEIFSGNDFTVSEAEWLDALEAPLAYKGGEGAQGTDYYRPIIDKVIAFYSD